MHVKRILPTAGLLLAAVALAGCEDNQLRRSMGLLHQGPDPFSSVPNRAIVFPDSDELPRPDPDARSPVQQDPLNEVREALALTPMAAAEPNPVETRLLALLDADAANPDIHALLEEMNAEEDDGTLFGPTPLVDQWFGLEERRVRREFALDPEAELQRLRAEGLLPTPPEPAPVDAGN